MLVQLPSASSSPPKASNADECTAFEAALRRDLATAPVVSYDAVLGGWSKRAVDLAAALLTAPIWLLVMLVAAGVAKLRHPAPVFRTEECVGYGGRAFTCYSLRIAPPSAVIERLRVAGSGDTPEPANDWGAMTSRAENGRAKWRRVFERMPQMINVIRGEMSLVGPAPLTADELEPLKTAKRHYLSLRPGVVGIHAIADADEEDPGHYKLYALCWSLSADALIVWDELRGLRNRGELWRPSFKLKRASQLREASVRRRSAG